MRTFIDSLSERIEEYVDGHSEKVQMTQDDLEFFTTVRDKIERVMKEQTPAEQEILKTTMRLLNHHERHNGLKEFEDLIRKQHILIPKVIKILSDVIDHSTIDDCRVYILNDSLELTVSTGSEEECRNKSRQLQDMLPDCECGYDRA